MQTLNCCKSQVPRVSLITKKAGGWIAAVLETGHGACGDQISGMFGSINAAGPVHYEDAEGGLYLKFSHFHRRYRRRIYTAPSQFEAGLPLWLTQKDDQTLCGAGGSDV